ncbi:MAG: nucleotide exchange factor GrpE [Rhodobacteraceae bacterium]|jgi:molecular chaperone GrpE|nr:nucleotide exchange factor GrpE [Paracoccaceae bacterium]
MTVSNVNTGAEGQPQAGATEPDAAAAAAAEAAAAEIARLEAENAELRDRFIRALAEAENARKRGERERREAEQYGVTRFARDMLPVYDNLRRALDAAGPEARAAGQALIEGVELTLRDLQHSFERHGIRRIAPALGAAFDPQLHEAMFEAPVPHVPAGGIIQVMTEGFLLHDRLLRPAQVGVSSSAPAPVK